MEEAQELVSIKFDKVMQSRSYTVVILSAPGKKFAIYTEPSHGKMMQMYLTGITKSRPLIYELLQKILRGFDIQVKQVVISHLEDTTYFARLFLEQKLDEMLHIVEIDARPSDCITLALLTHAPLFCTQEVLGKVVPVEE
ncbi:MAG: bifunctional nuclease family protein [Chlamydiia bacterium]|nr:bifunctional nuclease family protein [Chlamydiia bacterium]